jgi:hypothetical protein
LECRNYLLLAVNEKKLSFSLSGQLPFDSTDRREIFEKTIAAEINLETEEWKDVSIEAKNLVR